MKGEQWISLEMVGKAEAAPVSSVRVWRDGAAWRARVTLDTSAASGKRASFQRSYPGTLTEREAREAAEEWLKTFQGESVSAMLSAFADSVEALGAPGGKGPKANTAHMYRSMARGWAEVLPDKPADKVTQRDVLDGERRLISSGRSPSTVNAYFQFLSSAYGWAVDCGVVEASPTSGAAHPTEPVGGCEERAYTLAEARAIMSWMRSATVTRVGDSLWDREAALAVIVMLDTGMRLGEALALRWCDLRPLPPTLCVRGTVTERGRLVRQPTPKRGEARNVSISPSLLGLLTAHRGAYKPEDPLIGIGGAITSPGRVRKLLRRCCDDLGIEYRPPHALRHTHATLLINGGESIVAVQRRLGHSRPATTLNNYAHAGAAEDMALANAFSGYMGEQV